MHRIALTETEEAGLRTYKLAVGTPSQGADCFRLGFDWANKATNQKIEEINIIGNDFLKSENDNGDLVINKSEYQALLALINNLKSKVL
jgi:hypothetical protein